MAKKTPKIRSGLTLDQLNQLANRLTGTTNNVYRLSESMFGKKVKSDDIFPDLAIHCHIARCEECDEWKSLKSGFGSGVFIDLVDKQMDDVVTICTECEASAEEDDEIFDDEDEEDEEEEE